MDWQEQTQLDLIRAEARRKFQVLIDYVKENVGEGTEYVNDLVRVVVSPRGCYYEFVDLPEEFSGALGAGYTADFVTTGAGVDVLERVYELIRSCDESNTNELSVLVLYDHAGLYSSDETFVFHLGNGQDDWGPLSAGHFRPSTMPIFFKIKVDSKLARSLLGMEKGILFFVANLTDQHMLVRIPHQGPEVTDLGKIPENRTLH